MGNTESSSPPTGHPSVINDVTEAFHSMISYGMQAKSLFRNDEDVEAQIELDGGDDDDDDEEEEEDDDDDDGDSSLFRKELESNVFLVYMIDEPLYIIAKESSAFIHFCNLIKFMSTYREALIRELKIDSLSVIMDLVSKGVNLEDSEDENDEAGGDIDDSDSDSISSLSDDDDHAHSDDTDGAVPSSNPLDYQPPDHVDIRRRGGGGAVNIDRTEIINEESDNNNNNNTSVDVPVQKERGKWYMVKNVNLWKVYKLYTNMHAMDGSLMYVIKRFIENRNQSCPSIFDGLVDPYPPRLNGLTTHTKPLSTLETILECCKNGGYNKNMQYQESLQQLVEQTKTFTDVVYAALPDDCEINADNLSKTGHTLLDLVHSTKRLLEIIENQNKSLMSFYIQGISKSDSVE